MKIADEEMIPDLSDTGMAAIFLEVGQDVRVFEGMAPKMRVNEGVRQGYTEGWHFKKNQSLGILSSAKNTKR